MNVDVAGCTIFLTLAGSQAHGTAREGSDVDLRGVCIAPLRTRLSLFGSFQQYEGPVPDGLLPPVTSRLSAHPMTARALAVKTETVVFDIAKFVALCVEANPNALEILFADEGDWVFEVPAWRRLHGERYRFLTKKVQHTFLGYALAQLKKIGTHRSWLLHPPARKPSREDFGLPAAGGTLSRDDQNRIEQGIADKLRAYGVDDVEMPRASRVVVNERLEALWREALGAPGEPVEERMRAVASHALSVPADVMTTLNAEKRYRAAMKHWESFEQWRRERNPARAELERKHGYDTKHAMHLLRLMRMGVEALEEGELHVRRRDAAELNGVRDGALSFDELLVAATSLEEAMMRAARSSALPSEVDHEQVDELVFALVTEGASQART